MDRQPFKKHFLEFLNETSSHRIARSCHYWRLELGLGRRVQFRSCRGVVWRTGDHQCVVAQFHSPDDTDGYPLTILARQIRSVATPSPAAWRFRPTSPPIRPYRWCCAGIHARQRRYPRPKRYFASSSLSNFKKSWKSSGNRLLAMVHPPHVFDRLEMLLDRPREPESHIIGRFVQAANLDLWIYPSDTRWPLNHHCRPRASSW